MRYVNCVRCGKKIYEGADSIRHKSLTGFYCSFKCFAFETGNVRLEKVTEEYVNADKECNGLGFEEE